MNDEIPVSALLAQLLRPWKWIAAAAVLGALAGLAFALTRVPVYRAETLVAPVRAEVGVSGLGSIAERLGGIGSLAGITGGAGGETAELVALLKSRQMAQRFIANHELMPVLYAERWDARSGQWRTDVEHPAPTLNQAVGRFNSRIKSVAENKVTGMVTVTIDWTDPDLAARWANEFVAEVGQFARSRAIDESTRAIGQLQQQLAGVDYVEVRQAIFGAMESQITRRAMALSKPDFAFRVIDPAVKPDASAIVYPRRLLMVAAGGFAGLLLGGLGSIIYFLRRRNLLAVQSS